MLLRRTGLCLLSIVDYLKRSLVHVNSGKLFYWLWYMYVECLSWSVAKNVKRVTIYSLLVGLSFKKESMVKWSDGKVDECCEFFSVRLLQLIHKSFSSHSPLYFWRSRGQRESWQVLGHCAISTLFRSISVLASLGPFWYASSLTRPRGLEGFFQ